MKRLIKSTGIILFILFIVGEMIGRYLGFTDMPLYKTDKDYEYIPLPNQKRLVYRNKYSTNKFSMRSEPINEEDTINVLFMGDSVIYGGNFTDQDSLASTILEKELNAKFKKRVRVLNISAQSWGPDNVAAYIRKNGLFHAKLIVLVCSSQDAHDNMNFKTRMGGRPYYTENRFLAWQMIIEKSWPLLINLLYYNVKKENKISIEDKPFNSGFEYFSSISRQTHIPLIIYLHSTIDELNSTTYNESGREILNFCAQNNVPVIEGIKKEKASLFEDYIHLNNEGQKFLATMLYPFIKQKLQTN